MKVDFFLNHEEKQPGKQCYLFTKELTQIMNGEYIEHNGVFYQVTGQTIANPESKGQYGKNHSAQVQIMANRPLEITF